MKSRQSQRLVERHIERISSRAFDEYHAEITQLVGKKHGVYALYKRNKLYYVGLATNLRRRVKHHLRDRHKGKWDSFSLYLIRDVNYLRELESLIVHMAAPSGNVQAGKFADSVNLSRELGRLMQEKDRRRREEILGGQKSVEHVRLTRAENTRKSPSIGRTPVLKGKLPGGTKIQGVYKGREYFATVDESGSIRLEDRIFNSPSMAGIYIMKRAVNGWKFWKYQDKDGAWKLLDNLR
jgi:hypothetical protein